jgi:hypothetical protein
MTDTAPERALEETVPEALGARRIAALLAQHLNLAVTADDVAALVEHHHLEVVDSYKGWPLYATADALALDAELVRRVVVDRVAWEQASLRREQAAARIGWHWRDIQRMGEEGRITVRGGRYLIADLDRLAAEADGEQRLTAQAAAEVLEIRYPADWQYVEAAGWVRPVETYEQLVGRGRRTVTVALYRLGDVQALREMTEVDWEAVRGLPKGVPSPLREYVRAAPGRASVVKDFAQALADRHGVQVWAWHSPYTGGWELDWERLDGAPTKEQIQRELADDAAAASYASEITLCPRWGKITREARELLRPGAAVILDTETTDRRDGRTVEIAVIDAATGKTLMDTLVQPEAPISQGAYRLHRISDEDVADARTFDRILPRLRNVTKGRVICAYNEQFDRSVVVSDALRVGKKPMHLDNRDNWFCLMKSYADWLGSPRWFSLGGKHRAAGDCAAAREVLVEISRGRGTAFTAGRSAPGDPVPGPPAGTVVSATAI